MPDEKKLPHPSTHGIEPRKPEPPTVPVPAIPGPLAAMLKEIQDGVRTGFERTNANLDTLSHSFDGLQDRVARLEERESKSRTGPHAKFDGPQKTYSGPIAALKDAVASISTSDDTQNLTIESLRADIIAVQQAQEAAKAERHMTAEQVKAIHDTVVTVGKAFVDSPHWKLIKAIALFILAGYALTHGIKVGP